LLLGARLAEDAAKAGCRSLGTGEMGIGNTTPSTALFCAFLNLEPEDVAGAGAGLDAVGVSRKAAVVRTALEANSKAVHSGNAFCLLAALGGDEIACLAGLILGAARQKLLVMVDGFISTAAWLAAVKMAPAAAGYCAFGHASAEKAHKELLEHMGTRPLLDLGLRLGEGTGAALSLYLAHVSAQIFNKMATFNSANISKQQS
jgi:nicotinate-nucleotide--dimethylbenzimidazole phosphoribosyltransferase